MFDIAKFAIEAVITNPLVGVVVVALAGFGVAALAIYALLATVRALGRRR